MTESTLGIHRYYCQNLPESGLVELSEDESQHAVRVLRETVGDLCILFDGAGYESLARFAKVGPKHAIVEVLARDFLPRVLPGKVTLAVAMPKGDRQRDVIDKAVELGIHRFIPIVTERSVVQIRETQIDKWRRYIIEACKQCERNRFMEIRDSLSLSQWLEDIGCVQDGGSRGCGHWIVHPQSRKFDKSEDTTPQVSAKTDAATSLRRNFAELTFAIGPEGGFTSQEIALANERGFRTLDLGDRILRVDTAVCFVASLANLLVSA